MAHAILIINNTQQVYNSTNRKSKATAKEMVNYRISTYKVSLKNSQGSSNGSVGGRDGTNYRQFERTSCRSCGHRTFSHTEIVFYFFQFHEDVI